MIPEEFIKRIRTQNYLDAGSLMKALEETSPVSIRINPAKWVQILQMLKMFHGAETVIILKTDPPIHLIPCSTPVVTIHRKLRVCSSNRYPANNRVTRKLQGA